MQIAQSPAGAIDGLVDYPTERRYLNVDSDDGQTIRVHVVEAGPADGRPIVFLHGNPAWSYIWRHAMAAAAAAGYRAIAVDHVGSGMSDKPTAIDDYSVADHVAWQRSVLFDQLDVRDAIFVLHDWGGIIGLRLLAEQPDRIAGVAISNTGLPWRDPIEPLPEDCSARGPFADFQAMARVAPVWEPWSLLRMVMGTEPSAEVVAGYRAPYPDADLTIGSRAFTQLLPTRPDNPMLPDNFEAWKVLDQFEKPFVTIFSDQDVVAPTGYKELQARIPGAHGQPHVILEGGGHLLQEDLPEDYSQTLIDWIVTVQ
jgi:haloalkane dehalogenase